MANEKFYAVVEFEDGLQVIPNNWLDISMMKAVWPNFTNNKRYYKAVKLMEEPESTWMEHSIRKVYGTYSNYAVARKKLKQAEDISDLNSGTDKEEILKKSRKFRAAKTIDTSTTSNDELSDESYISDLPNIPDVPTKVYNSIANITQKSKIAKDAQKDFNATHEKNVNTVKNTSTYSLYTKKRKTNDSQLSKPENIELFDDDGLNSMTVYNSSLQDSQNSKNWNEDFSCCNDMITMSYNSNEDNNNDVPRSSSNLSKTRENVSYTSRNVSTIEQGIWNNNNGNNDSDNLQQSIIRKFTNFDMKFTNLDTKINEIKNKIDIILKNLQKIAICNVEVEEKDNIDVYQDLPLKDEASVQLMETKLNNDSRYRNQMIKQLLRVTCKDIKASCIRLMRATISNEVAVKYSWYGAKKKQVFSQLEICKVIMHVIRKAHTDTMTDEEISTPIKIWLAHATERLRRSVAQE